MPLHSIPLCNVKYVGESPLSGATFKYDTTFNIALNNKTKLAKRDDVIEIDKINTRRLYDYDKIAQKNNYRLVYSCDLMIDKNVLKNLYDQDRGITKNNDISLESYIDPSINKEATHELGNDYIRVLDISDSLSLNNIRGINIILANEYLLKSTNKEKGINKCGSVELDIYKDNRESNLFILYEYSLGNDLINQIEYYQEYQVQIKHKDKDITQENCIDLDVNHTKNIELSNVFNIDRMVQHETSKHNTLSTIRDINCKMGIQGVAPLSKDSLKTIQCDFKPKGVNKADIKNINKSQFNLLKNISCKHITKDLIINLKSNSNKQLSKIIFKLIRPAKIKEIFNLINPCYLKKSPKNIDISPLINVSKVILKPIRKDELSFVHKDRKTIFSLDNHKWFNKYRKPVFLNDLSGLNKNDKPIFLNDYMPVYKEPIPIINHELGFLEVTQRWWVLNATAPYDKKILPYDYGYSNKPLYINRRDRPFGGHLGPIDAHPITDYISKASNGYDTNYGLNEFALSIEIMLDMTNIVAMILNHSASQFVNCSGQESMEFILEVIYDWLNLDSTKYQMNVHGSREHYLRCYRWIRWEAEKIWFTADKDHTQDRMRGLSYAGKLFENLADYLKFHHFNIVPLWRNIKFMDIERQYNRLAVNNDLIKSLNKYKCNRHYFIETNKK